MKIIETTAVLLISLLILGTAQESKAAPIQPIASPTQQENIILTHWHGHYGWHGHHHWHHGWYGHRHWGGGYWGGWYGPGFHRVCGFNAFGEYYCYRRYY